VAWGYSPIEFWKTHPTEFFWVAETKAEQNKPRAEYAGGMTGAQVEAIYREAYGDD
jgi:hypothetical protein